MLGKEPATVDPLFLDEMRDKPNQSYSVKLGDKTLNLSLADVIYDTPNGDFPHPNTMTCKLMGGDKAIYELEYYSPGGGFYEWKGYTPPKKGQPKYPYETMKELRQHAEKNNLSIAQLMMANELAVSGKTEEQINAFLDKIAAAMLATVKAGLDVKEGVLPGPIKLHSKAAEVWKRAQDDKYEADRAVALLSACALAASEENARGHLVITAPTGGSAGVMPAIVYGLTQTKRALPQEKVRQGLLAGAAIGYLCKHNATLSGAEGGCQSEIGVASAMSAAFIASAMDASPLVVENAAESALEHHLGMTCDPVAGYVQVPCIERCAFGAVKAWTAYMIATNEIASRHRVDLDTTIETLAETGKDMLLKPKIQIPTGSGLELLEIAVRNPELSGKSLGDLMPILPSGVQIIALRREGRNEPASPNLVIAENDVLLAVASSKETLSQAGTILGEAAPGHLIKDRRDLDYLRVFASRPTVVGRTLGDLDLPGDKASVLIQIRRGDSDLLPRPDLVLEFGDRVGVLAHRGDFAAMRKYFGDSIKGTAEFSYISIGIGMAFGFLIGAIQVPLPGVGKLAVGLAGVLIM